MSEVKVNKISPRSGTGVQLGDSGDTITIPAGATISNAGTAAGFGSTGEVSWDTTPKTGDFTGVSGVGYFINSGGGAVIVTLPGSPSAGNVVAVSDYNGTAATNAITIARNGSNINGSATNLIIAKANSAVQLVYVDATTGWQGVTTANPADITSEFISATGGAITTSGDFKIHTFTGPGTFVVTAGSCTSNNEVSYLIVAGGGAGGTGTEAISSVGSGGGGAGGFRERRAANDSYTVSPLNGATPITVTSQSYPITVGAGSVGRASSPTSCTGNNPQGGPSTFSTVTSAGGGYGISRNGTPNCLQVGGAGGSGGGSAFGISPNVGGAGNTPPTSPAQGTNGGLGSASSPSYPGGGGGGATTVGEDALPHPAPGTGAAGGAGATTNITGSPVAYAGGGGGGIGNPGGPSGSGGSGGGGAGAGYPPSTNGDGAAATANTGGGGGGAASGGLMGGTVPLKGGNGGSGIVIIRYKFQ
jgi:hypothetical protein